DLVGRAPERGDEPVADPSERGVVAVIGPAVPGDGGDSVAIGERGDGTLREAGQGEDEVDEGIADRRSPQDVEATADERILELAQIAVDIEDEIVERIVARRVADAEVAMELGLHEQVPHLLDRKSTRL